jgi:hypothetical protein
MTRLARAMEREKTRTDGTYQLAAAAAAAAAPQRLAGGPVHEREREVSLVVRHAAGVPKALDPALHAEARETP